MIEVTLPPKEVPNGFKTTAKTLKGTVANSRTVNRIMVTLIG